MYTFKLKDVCDGVFMKPHLAIVLDVVLGMGSQRAVISMEGHGLLRLPHTGFQLVIEE